MSARRHASPPGRAALPLLALALAAGWVLAQAALHRGHHVDDAFIGFRYAEHLAAGNGLVFEPGERVEGVTNAGWIALLGLLGALGLSVPVAAKVAGTLFLLGAIGLAAWTAGRLATAAGATTGAAEAAAVVLVAAASPELVYFSLAGMETGLAALLAAGGAALVASGRWWSAAVLAAALATVRPEALVLFPLFVGLAILAGRLSPSGIGDRSGLPLRRLGGPLVLFVVLTGAVVAGRLAYYGEPIPNTFHAKPAAGPVEAALRLPAALAGDWSNLPPPFDGLLFPAAAALALASLARRADGRRLAAWLAAAAATGYAFALYAPLDWTEMGRWFGPWVPAAAVLLVRGLFAGLARLARLAPGGRGPLGSEATAVATTAVVVAVLAVVAAGVWRFDRHLGAAARAEMPGFILVSESLVPPARWLDAALAPDATIATRRLGVLSYYTGRPMFDYAFGLVEPDVARRVGRRGVDFVDPREPELAGPWRRAAPDVLVEDLERIEEWLGPGGSRRPFAVHGTLYRVTKVFPIAGGHRLWAAATAIGPAPPGTAGSAPPPSADPITRWRRPRPAPLPDPPRR